MYNPYQIILAPSNSCNLKCSHCFIEQYMTMLHFEKIENFLISVVNAGINRMGFSGGEPFLHSEFLCKAIAFAIDHDMLFDTIITNGVWFTDNAFLNTTLQNIYNAGFDGRFAVSVDIFHKTAFEKLDASESYISKICTFCQHIFTLWQDAVIDFVVVLKDDCENKESFVLIENIANALDAHLITENGVTKKIILPKTITTRLKYEGQQPFIPITTIDYTHDNPHHHSAWQAKQWFNEDFCAGPGQIIYVHPNGNIAPCCGYANEHKKLCIGNALVDSFDIVMNRIVQSQKNFTHIIYNEGLQSVAKTLEKKGHNFPNNGKTQNACLFCHYLLELQV
ncbi:MAG: radical SAM/SPASM domain-containing protein [Treponemataceae bacterium]